MNAMDKKEQTPLHLASARGLTDTCRKLLESKAKISLRDKNCWSALHHATDGRHYETATLLAKRGIDLNAEEHKHGRTALHICAEKGYFEFVEMLLIRGADLYASGDSFYSKTPLHLACLHGHTETVRILVKRGAMLEALSGFLDQTPLHMACESGHLDCVKVLVENGANLSMIGNRINGSTALHLSAEHGQKDIVKYLVENGANMNQLGRYTTFGTALHVACRFGRTEIACLLVELGTYVDVHDDDRKTPLHVACESSYFDIAFALIDLGADVYTKALNGKTPLDYVRLPTVKANLEANGIKVANEKKRLKVLEDERLEEEARLAAEREEKLMEKIRLEEIELERLAEEKVTFIRLVHAATDISGEKSALLAVAEKYHDQNINTVLVPENGSTALTCACSRAFTDVALMLLDWPGININIADGNGDTPLHHAARVGDVEIVQQLLLLNAKTGLMNKQGKVAANVAKSNFLCEVIRNPSLIKHRISYQEKVMQDIFQKAEEKHLLAIAGGNDSGDELVVGNSCNIYEDEDNVLPIMDTQGAVSAVIPYPLTANKQKSQFLSSPPAVKPLRPSTNNHKLISEETEAFTKGKYGPVPSHFGGCRADLFFGNGDVDYQLTVNADGNLIKPEQSMRVQLITGSTEKVKLILDLYTLQQSYLPSSFDTTEEWCDVKDFLWLLGYSYRLNEGTTEMERDLVDVRSRKYLLYRIARTMDKIQRLFTHQEVLEDYQLDTLKPTSAKFVTSNILPAIGSPSQNQVRVTSSRFNSITTEDLEKICQKELSTDLHGGVAPARPYNVSLIDYLRLIRFSKLLNIIVCHTVSFYEPAECSWRTIMYGSDFDPNSNMDKIELLYRMKCYSKDLRDELLKINSLAMNRDNTRKISSIVANEQNLEQDSLTNVNNYGDFYTTRDTYKYPHEKELSKSSFRKALEKDDSLSGYANEGESLEREAASPRGWQDIITTKTEDLFLNPPRYMRVAVDAIFDAMSVVKCAAEAIYPLDAVRAHLWQHNGRKLMLKRQQERQHSVSFEENESRDNNPATDFSSPTNAKPSKSAKPRSSDKGKKSYHEIALQNKYTAYSSGSITIIFYRLIQIYFLIIISEYDKESTDVP